MFLNTYKYNSVKKKPIIYSCMECWILLINLLTTKNIHLTKSLILCSYTCMYWRQWGKSIIHQTSYISYFRIHIIQEIIFCVIFSRCLSDEMKFRISGIKIESKRHYNWINEIKKMAGVCSIGPSEDSYDASPTGSRRESDVNATSCSGCQVYPEDDKRNLQISDGKTKGESKCPNCGLRTLKIVTSLVCGILLGIGLEKARGMLKIKESLSLML